MAKLRWLKWGMSFSVIIFIVIYFLIYKKVIDNPTTVLMLGNTNISSVGDFLSNIKNVILSSLILGFLLGAIPAIGSRKKEDSDQFGQN